MSSPTNNIGRNPSVLQPPQLPKPGTFKAGYGATHRIPQDHFISIAQAIETPENQQKLAALPGEFKLKTTAKQSSDNTVYFQWTPPPIYKAGKWSAYDLEFELIPRSRSTGIEEFVKQSLGQATRIYTALQGHNAVPPGKKGNIIHSPYISPKLIMHQDGGISRYEAAKQAFAQRQAELEALAKAGVKVKMLKDGSTHIQVAGPHFYSSNLVDKKIPLPANTDASNIGNVVNENIDYARAVAFGKGRRISVPAPVGGNQGGLTSASASPLNTNNISRDEALARQLHEQLNAEESGDNAFNDTSRDAELARSLQEQDLAASSQQTHNTAHSSSKKPVFDEEALEDGNFDEEGEKQNGEPLFLQPPSQATTTVVQKQPPPPPPPKPTHLLNTVGGNDTTQGAIKPPPPPRKQPVVLLNQEQEHTVSQKPKPPAVPPGKPKAAPLPVTQQSASTVGGNNGNKKQAAPPPPPTKPPVQNQSNGQLPIAIAKPEVPGKYTAEVDKRAADVRKRVIGNGSSTQPPSTQPDSLSMQGGFAAAAAARVQNRNGNGNGTSVQQPKPIQQQKANGTKPVNNVPEADLLGLDLL